jgi:hypothetical protein
LGITRYTTRYTVPQCWVPHNLITTYLSIPTCGIDAMTPLQFIDVQGSEKRHHEKRTLKQTPST